MPAPEDGDLPKPCRAVAIFPADESSPLRIVALVRPGPPAAPVILRSSWLGRAYLGAILDLAHRVHGWLEIWVQTSGEGVPGDGQPDTNPEIDARWRRWAARVQSGAGAVATGWEQAHPAPTWLDVGAGRPVVPRDPASGKAYGLCTDDGVLMAAGLDTFSESARRFLSVPGEPAAGVLAPVGEVPSGARGPDAALPGAGAGLVPFNPEAGFILVRRLAPLEWEAYGALLSGRPFPGLGAGTPPVKLGGPYAALEDWDSLQQGGAYLFSTSRGRAGRFHETFHLKLLLFQSMLREVRAAVAASQLPLLNLGAAAFRVDLSAAGGALPVLWTARAVLAGPPGGIAIAAPGELRFYRSLDGFGASIYRPEGAGRAIRGTAELRIRKLVTGPGGVQVEGTVVSADLAKASPRDLVSARVALPGLGALALVGTIDAADALAGGEARFRTATLSLGPALLAALQRMEGGVIPGTPYETIPILSTPVDLYALGVLGTQLFLTGAGKPLALALDELLSLVRAADAAGGGATAGERFRALAAADPRWNRSLGPENHGHGTGAPADAAAFLPAELWWDVLALLGRFFAGSGPAAFCRDFGDAPPYQLEAAFDGAVAAVDAAVLSSQSLLLCDWPHNREIARLIQKAR